MPPTYLSCFSVEARNSDEKSMTSTDLHATPNQCQFLDNYFALVWTHAEQRINDVAGASDKG